MLKRFIIGLLIFAILIGQAQALSYDKVKDASQYYANKGEEQVVVPTEMSPLIYNDVNYFFAYLAPQDAQEVKNLVLIIREEGEQGRLETREDVLKLMYSVDYDLDSIKALRDRKIGLEDLKNVVSSLKNQIDNSESAILENIKRQSEDDFTSIDDALYDMQSSIDDAEAVVDDGLIAKENFYASATTTEISQTDLQDVISKNEDAINSFYRFAADAELYQKAVSQKLLETKDQQVASELSKIGNLKVGDAILKSYNASLAQKKKDFDIRKSRKSALLNDSIQSLYARKAKVEARNAFAASQQKGLIDSLVSSKNDLIIKQCKLSSEELKRRWEAIKTAMDMQEYELVPLKLMEAEEIADNLNSRLQGCVSATATPTAKPSGFDYKGLILPAVVVLAIVFAVIYLGNYMKPKGDEIQE
ncbi:MAG: hypothetical protein ABIG96_04425 [Candidatus Micrarchaeota archaeon]